MTRTKYDKNIYIWNFPQNKNIARQMSIYTNEFIIRQILRRSFTNNKTTFLARSKLYVTLPLFFLSSSQWS